MVPLSESSGEVVGLYTLPTAEPSTAQTEKVRAPLLWSLFQSTTSPVGTPADAPRGAEGIFTMGRNVLVSYSGNGYVGAGA